MRLKRTYKQGDNPLELTFTSKSISEGTETEFALVPDESTFADGNYSKGAAKIKVVCNKDSKKNCSIQSEGSISDWHSKKEPHKKLKGVDKIKVMDFKLICNTKALVIEEPAPNACGE